MASGVKIADAAFISNLLASLKIETPRINIQLNVNCRRGGGILRHLPFFSLAVFCSKVFKLKEAE